MAYLDKTGLTYLWGKITSIFAKKTDVPTALSQLSQDSTHRIVTDTEKATWNAKSNFSGSYNDLTNKPTIPAAVTVDNALSSTSANPVQNKVINTALSNKADKSQAVFYIEGTGTTEGTWLGSHSGITAYYNGLTIAYKVNIAGASNLTLNINNLGAVAVVRNVNTAVTTHYGVNSVVILTYTVDNGTAYWKLSDYDSDTKTRSSNKADSKMFIIGASSQSTSGQTTYSNSKCYIGADNCLYSNGVKVATTDAIPTVPSSLPANGGNADTVDGYHIRTGTSGAAGYITFVV